jgi:hypothetical protein
MRTSTVHDSASGMRSPTVGREFARPDPWLTDAIAPDFLVPAQYYDLIRRRSRIDGEMRLVFAVLEDAVRCYVRGANTTSRIEREHRDEVIGWFATADASHVPFSFGYVCDVLGIVPAELRGHLDFLRPEDLPTKQMRSVGRRQVMRAARRRSSRGIAGTRSASLGAASG